MANIGRPLFMPTFLLAIQSFRLSGSTSIRAATFCSPLLLARKIESCRIAPKSAGHRFMSPSAGSDEPSDRSGDSTANPPLIDVDCNLVHSDLVLLLTPSGGGAKGASEGEGSEPGGGVGKIMHPALKILHHPSTKAANVVAALSPASTVEEAEETISILSSHDLPIPVLTTVGVHPYQAGEVGPPSPESLDRIRSVIASDLDGEQRPFVCCVGECGLDYSEGFPPRNVQIPWFEAQLDLAFEFELPVFLHERLAFEDALRLIDEATERHSVRGGELPPVIVHCFTGTRNECAEYVRRGYHVSVSGFINKNGDGPEEVRATLRDGVVPLDRLMIETDAPYLGFPSCRDTFFQNQGEAFDSLKAKKRKALLKGMYPNVPSALPLVLDGVVQALNEGRDGRDEDTLRREDVAKITTRNAINFFGFTQGMQQRHTS